MPESNYRSFTGGDLQTNAYTIATQGGVILFDAPEGVCEWLASEGQRPVLLLLTHGHFDHVMDAAKVVRKFGCPVGCHPEDAAMVSEEGFYRSWGYPVDVEPVTVALDLNKEGAQNLGGVDFELFHVPGHSMGSLCFLMKASSLLIGGDVLFAGGIGRWDLPGGDGPLLVRGITEKLLPLPDETIVLPGHGPATTILRERSTNPFLAAGQRGI
jgi:glyoxylase-like metal-dependent hydrolase (beta-lactamase superfamily II)